MLTSPHHKNWLCYEHEHLPRTWIDTLVRPEQQKMAMRCGTWNVRSLYRPGSLIAAVRELERYKLYVVGVQEVRWDKGAQSEQEIIILSMEKEMKIITW